MIITATSQSPRRVTLVDEVSGNLTYIGIAKLGTADATPGWQILRIQKTGALTSLQYADGNARFDNVWDDRASLTYTN